MAIANATRTAGAGRQHPYAVIAGADVAGLTGERRLNFDALDFTVTDNGPNDTLDVSVNFPAGTTTFTGLTDTPANYAGAGAFLVRVNAGATALEFLDPSTDFLLQYVHNTVARSISAAHTFTGQPKFDSAAPGTPFTIGANSTGVLVADLNADLLDGEHGAAYALLAGRAGGQTLVGGTGAGDPLTLRATANATDGAIIFQTDPTTERARILATGEFLLGRTTAFSSFDIVNFETSANATRLSLMRNTSSGASAFALWEVRNNATDQAGYIGISGTGFGAIGDFPAGSTVVVNSAGTANGLMLRTNNATPIRFHTNGVERLRVLGTGELLHGSVSALFAGTLAEHRRDQNAVTRMAVVNGTSGTAAQAVVNAAAGALQAVSMYYTSSGFTPALGQAANEAGISALGASALKLLTLGAFPVVFSTNQAERARIDDDATAGQTAMLLSVGGAAVSRVSVGADDSGGVGFRLLRVPN